jgi:hypothetical protein
VAHPAIASKMASEWVHSSHDASRWLDGSMARWLDGSIADQKICRHQFTRRG